MTPTTSRTVSIGAALVLVAALAGLAVAQTADPAAPAPSAGDARKACSAAMNADPAFAAEIVKVADERAALKRDADTVAAHVDANQKIQRNERHVIYAYAAMWIIAALFVVFMWWRQQGLKAELAQLRRDLDAATKESK